MKLWYDVSLRSNPDRPDALEYREKNTVKTRTNWPTLLSRHVKNPTWLRLTIAKVQKLHVSF